jgi:ATP-dependent Lon protease
VLPVGGIKAKVLAAHRAGLSRVILPEKNRRDVDDVPEDTRSQLEIVFVSDMAEVLEHALDPSPEAGPVLPSESGGHGESARLDSVA